MRKRKGISLEVRLAAMTLAWLREGSAWRKPNGRMLTHAEAKGMTAKQINRLVEWHHWPIAFRDGGPDEPWNLDPVFKAEHLEITKKQATRRAHERKVKRSEAKHRVAMKLKSGVDLSDIPEADEKWFKKAKLSWPSRPFPSAKRK